MSIEKEAQALVSRLRRESESGELAKKQAARAKEISESLPKRPGEPPLDMKTLLERTREQPLVSRPRRESESGELARKEAARANEISESLPKRPGESPLDMKGLLERKRELERQKK